MSGTSLDGIDLAIVNFKKEQNWNFRVMSAETIPYSPFWQRKLSISSSMNSLELDELDKAYTAYLGEVIQSFMHAHSEFEVDFISSHGHTVLHEPDRGITFQIGNLPSLSTLINKKVICDFRSADVARGGQGAPLVPGGEVHLFSQYDALINLGGFANCTQLTGPNLLAYDICPVNVVLNTLSQELGFSYDNKGELARSGEFNDQLFNRLSEIDFYDFLPPKSLGIEWVKKNINPIILEFSSLKTIDLLHTFSHHFSEQIAKQLPNQGEVLFSGGGVYNRFLMELINEKTNCKICIPSKEIIEFKEAIIFAFLGVLRELNQPNCLAAVTGADLDHSSGKIYFY